MGIFRRLRIFPVKWEYRMPKYGSLKLTCVSPWMANHSQCLEGQGTRWKEILVSLLSIMNAKPTGLKFILPPTATWSYF